MTKSLLVASAMVSTLCLGAIRQPSLLQPAERYLAAADTEQAENDINPDLTLEAEETPGSTQLPVKGLIESRPSYTGSNGGFFTENLGSVSYELNPDTIFTYEQHFNTNMYDPTGKTTGVNPFAKEGIIRARFNNVWADESSGLYFNYEPRVYLPTFKDDREAGLITYVRQYLMLKKEVNPLVTVTAMDIPIVFAYDRSGALIGGTDTANPIFENRIYLVTDLNFTKALTLSVPVMFHFTRYRQHNSGSLYNNSWGYFAWVYPELAYQVNPNIAVGAAYKTDNLVKWDLKDTTFKEGFQAGVTQVFLRASM